MIKYIISLIIIAILTPLPVWARVSYQPIDDFYRNMANDMWFLAEICIGIMAACNLTSYITSGVNMRWRLTAWKVVYVVINIIIFAWQAMKIVMLALIQRT